jgi:hypothetical protein
VTATLPWNTTRSHSPADCPLRGCALVAAAVRSSDDGGRVARILGGCCRRRRRRLGTARPENRAFPNKLHRRRPSDPRGSLRRDLSLLPSPEEEERERLSGFCWLMDVDARAVPTHRLVRGSEGHPSVARPTHVTPIGTLPSVEATREGPLPSSSASTGVVGVVGVVVMTSCHDAVEVGAGKWFVVGTAGKREHPGDAPGGDGAFVDVRGNRGRDGGRGARDDGTRTAPTRRNRPAVGGRNRPGPARGGLRFATRGSSWAAATAERSNRALVARGQVVTEGVGPLKLDRRAKGRRTRPRIQVQRRSVKGRLFQSKGRRVPRSSAAS